MSGGDAAGCGARLRLARRAHGLSQLQLAGMAGVSRQSVSAVESGVSDPSLRVAIALARALGLTVEELFGADDPVAPVVAAPVAPLGGTGARVTLAAMADGYVALPLRGMTASQAGIRPAGGLVAGDGHDQGQMARTVRPVGPVRPTLVAAGWFCGRNGLPGSPASRTWPAAACGW